MQQAVQAGTCLLGTVDAWLLHNLTGLQTVLDLLGLKCEAGLRDHKTSVFVGMET